VAPHRFSPSQFKTADHDGGGCETKWFLEKIEGHAPPSSRSQALGTAVHAALEAWQRDGTPLPDDDAGRIAAPALELLPPRESVALIEEERTFILPRSGAAVLCRIDFSVKGPGGTLAPWDFKTTSNQRYAKSPEELAKDLQMACYAHALAPGVDTRVSHVYLLTKGRPRAWISAARSVVDVRAREIDRLDTLAERLIELREDGRRDSARKHERGSDACRMYGGCPHQSICFSSPKGSSPMSSMLEKIKAAQAARMGTPPAAPVAPPPVAPPPAAGPPPDHRTHAERSSDEQWALQQKAPALVFRPRAPAAAPQSVTPPDAPPDAPCVPFVEDAAPGSPVVTPAIIVGALSILATDGVLPKRRGRPPGSKNRATLEAAALSPAAVESLAASVPEAPPAAPPAPVAAPAAPPAPVAAPSFPPEEPAGFGLLIDCVPTKGDPRDPARPLAGYLAAIALDVAAAAEVSDWREIAYGKGAGLIAAAIRAAPPTGGTWYVDSSGPTSKVAIEVLEALASTVIRGV
jgi:hypothetical protein